MDMILVVDDDAIIRKISEDILKGGGYNVIAAKNVDEAVDAIRNNDIKTILLDVFMPKRLGFELMPIVLEINPDISVIIMTAYASMDSVIEALRRGAYDYIRKPFAEEELLHTVEKAVERTNLLIGNRDLVNKLEERIDRLELFEKTSKVISSTIDLHELLEKVMDISKTIMKAEACSVLLVDESSGDLVFTVALGDKVDKTAGLRIKPGQGIAGWVLQNGSPLLIRDVRQDDRFYKGIDEKTGFETKSMIAVPLLTKKQTVGVLEVINRTDGGYFDEIDKENLVIMAGHMAVTIENAKMAEQLIQSAERCSRNLEAMVQERTSELEQANRDLKSAQAQLLQTEKLSSLGQLAAGIAHEINNPIGFINSNLRTMGEYMEDIVGLLKKYDEMCQAHQQGDIVRVSALQNEVLKIKKAIKYDMLLDDAKKLINESRDGAYRIYKIVRDMKGFARADDAEKKFVDIHELLDRTLNIVWNELKYKAEVIKEYGDIAEEVECLPTQMNQVFLNILVNAAQAMKGRGKIKIKTYSEEENIVVEISDTGSGIPDEYLSKIFDPFFTTKEPGKGTGLGLSIVYGIIKKHNGEIKVNSRMGEGTTFSISIPMKMADSGDDSCRTIQ